jgi:hypothetical protein
MTFPFSSRVLSLFLFPAAVLCAQAPDQPAQPAQPGARGARAPRTNPRPVEDLSSWARVQAIYKVEDVATPKDVPPEVGGLAFDSQGTLYMLLRRGDVLTTKPVADPTKFQWKFFATGFDNGNGIVVPEPNRVLVTQMAELTEATDTDKDGVADRYRTINSDWGLSGNYHEANAICSDGKGGYYLGLGTASFSGPTFFYTKGDYNAFGRRGRNYSSVAYRGWSVHVAADGTFDPIASGFRMLNGLTMDDEGNLWSSDNQGDWKAVTPFYRILKGNFYGHPSSLVWDPTWPKDKDPLQTFHDDLDAYNQKRTWATVEIPHLEMVRSGAEPIQIPRNGSFGAFGGQMLLPDNAGARFARIMLEKVEGDYQGSCTLFLMGQVGKPGALHSGNNRVRFSPDGKSLYVGQTERGWGAPAEGLQRITWQGGVPFTIEMINITPTGFRLTFTAPFNAEAKDAANYAARSNTYQPKWTYGASPENVRDEKVTSVKVINDRTVELSVTGLEPRHVYRIQLSQKIESATAESPASRDFYYTANRVPGWVPKLAAN